MGHLVQIGNRIFQSKKSALKHYKNILSSYSCGEILTENNTGDVLELLATHPRIKDKIGVGVKAVRVTKSKYNIKCFELVRKDNSTELFSYTKRINSPPSPFTKFSQSCRKIIQEDLRNVKLGYFKKHSKNGKVRCQETGKLLKYDELNIDHRQPNTFSIIVDRFIEINNIDLESINYNIIDGECDEISDYDLQKQFKEYHRKKANLRLVKRNLNSGRSYQAKITRQKKDLRID